LPPNLPLSKHSPAHAATNTTLLTMSNNRVPVLVSSLTTLLVPSKKSPTRSPSVKSPPLPLMPLQQSAPLQTTLSSLPSNISIPSTRVTFLCSPREAPSSAQLPHWLASLQASLTLNTKSTRSILTPSVLLASQSHLQARSAPEFSTN